MQIKIARPITRKEFRDMGIFTPSLHELMVEGATFNVSEKRMYRPEGKYKYHLKVQDSYDTRLVWIWEDFVLELQ